MRRGGMRDITQEIITPCEGSCTLVEDTCSRCGRTDKQIERWLYITHEERVEIIKGIKKEKRDGKRI
jgi:predicted Fe-S protein YdhL (DUF1289 family)